MGSISKIAITAFLALAIASCSSEGEQAGNPTPINTPVASQPFNDPVVSAKPTLPTPTTTSNLIQPTNARERLGIVSKGRNDPFAEIVRPYSVGVPNTTVVARPIPKLPPLAVAKGTQSRVTSTTSAKSNQQKLTNKTAIARNTGRGTPGKNPVSKGIASAKVKPSRALTLPKVLPQVVPNPGLASVLPPPPQPELARAVFVSGVVLLGREPQAIIKVPNEPTSRYVQAGQRLANGVSIKRIEINEGSEPVVILEQYGMEVARMVGEGSATQTPPTATSEGNSVSSTVPPQNPVPGGAT
jgi:hypothetical protein